MAKGRKTRIFQVCLGSPHPALRRPAPVALDRRWLPFLAWLHHHRLQPLPEEREHGAVHDPHPHTSHQLVVRDGIEVLLQVRVVHGGASFFELLEDDLQRLLSTPSGAKPEGAFLEVRFEDRFQKEQDGRLHHPIAHRRDPQRSQFPVRLGDVDPPDRGAPVAFLCQGSPDLFQEGLHPFPLDMLRADSIHPSGPIIGQDFRPGRLQGHRMADQAV